MNVYEQRKQAIDVENKTRRNPTYQTPEMALPTNGMPKSKQLTGLAGTPIQPKKEIPEHQKGSFFKQKMAHQKASPMFDKGTNMIEQVAAELGQAVQKGHMPRSLAEKKLKQAIDDFAKDSKGLQMAKMRKDSQDSERNQENKMELSRQGKSLRDSIVAAKNGDDAAQEHLRDIKFDWTKPKADATVKAFDEQQNQSAKSVTEMAVEAEDQANDQAQEQGDVV